MITLQLDALRSREHGPYHLEAQAPDCLCLSGASGAGKTLLFRSIADLDPHEGKVRLNGVDAQTISAPVWRKRVGFLPAESKWWFEKVGDHFVTYDVNMLNRLGFAEDVLNWETHRLSSGEKQRLALIRLLANKPEVLLLDEPTAALDRENVVQTEKLLKDYRIRSKVLVMWISHDPEQIRRIADKHYLLQNNQLFEKVYDDLATPFSAML